MNYIFCGAYKALLFALYLKDSGEEITIVAYNKDLIKYCETEHIDYIEFDCVRLKVTTLYLVFKFKRILDETIEKIGIKKEDAFFLLGNVKGYDYFYLARKLSKKCNFSYYKSVDLEGRELKKFKPPWYKPMFIRGEVLRIVLKIFLGLDLIYYDTHKVPCLGIGNEFLEKYNIQEYDPDHSAEELIFEGLTGEKNVKEYDNFIINDGLLTEYINFDSMEKLYKELLELPIKFAFKKHPTSLDETEFEKNYFKLFKHCEEIPRYVPAELICNNIKKNVISMFSTALITASHLQHLKTISLLELVEWHDKETKEGWRRTLSNASKNKILFPTSFEELEKILTDE